ncbi:MAG: hypothetical protein P1P84_17415 [Deferrisomatales bacterium]|nr:hypothetical protein [Deferrisomatales bacterium]
MAAAIAMSVGAYRTQLLFDNMKGQAATPTAGEKTGETHPPGAT